MILEYNSQGFVIHFTCYRGYESFTCSGNQNRNVKCNHYEKNYFVFQITLFFKKHKFLVQFSRKIYRLVATSQDNCKFV